MAELALTLPVVIASASDVRKERDVVERVIEASQKRAAQHRLLLEPVRWERDMRPTFGAPQRAFNNDHLRRAELVVFVFWSSLGSPAEAGGAETGVLQEFRLAQEFVRSGSSDDVFVYFREPAGASAGERDVDAFKRDVTSAKKLITSCDYTDLEDLQGSFERHLRQWLDRWIGVPDICEETMWKVPPSPSASRGLRENRLHAVLLHFDLDRHRCLADAVGAAAIRAYQQFGSNADGVPLDSSIAIDGELIDGDGPPASWSSIGRIGVAAQPPVPFARSRDGRLRFADAEWFYFFCAVGLFGALLNDNSTAVSRHPYVNNTHQYLAALVERELDKRTTVVTRLAEWLDATTPAGRGQPIVRNFAAYVLGMIGATEAEDSLADAARDDAGEDVRTYAICALGKLRSRRHLGLLTKLRGRAHNERERLLIGQAICRITGVAHYEL